MMKRIIVTLLALCGFLSHGHCELPTAPDAIVQNIEIQTGCLGDIPVYNVEYMVLNIGEEPITEYCIELWNEDYYQCFDSDLFGSYEIPPGEGQVFTTQFFEFTGIPGGLFVVSVDGVNDEIITGNNNTTVYYPEEWEVCPIECVADTIVITEYENVYITDTLLITEYENVYIYDTTYIEVTDTILVDNYIYETDTLFLTEYVTDTVFITTIDTLIQYEYILINDTVTEYIVQEIYIDCDTDLPCDEGPELDCPDWTSIYIPNTFTPNNDGINDVWKIILDLNCWYNIEFQIYNRWGDKIYHGYGDSFYSYPFWNGSIDNGGHHAIDGVYTYIVKANKSGSAEVFHKTGHLTVFR